MHIKPQDLVNSRELLNQLGHAHHDLVQELDLSRFCAAPSARLSHLSFEGDRAFPAQC